MVALSLALVGTGIGLFAGAWVMVPGLVFVMAAALVVVATGCAAFGFGFAPSAGYVVLMAVSVQIGYALMVLTPLGGDAERKARRREQARRLARFMRRSVPSQQGEPDRRNIN